MQESDIRKCGLRELKRRRTRRQLEDSATSLVLKNGYDKVTLEDICAGADVSRRTFFNYFDSKDHAVFGPGILSFSMEDAEAFAQELHDDVLDAMLAFLERKAFAAVQEDDDLDDPIAWHRDMRSRRRQIIASDPFLTQYLMMNFGTNIKCVRAAFVKYFDNHPDSRLMPEMSAEEEVTLSIGFVRECVLFTAIHDDDIFNSEPLRKAARQINTFSRRTQW